MFNLNKLVMRNSTLRRGGFLSLLLLGFAISLAYAQESTITGKVVSVEEGALPGVISSYKVQD